MTIDEMRRLKRELGLSYADISQKSGIPLSTVQKVLGGSTKSPRYRTLNEIERVLADALSLSARTPGKETYEVPASPASLLKEEPGVYHCALSGSAVQKYPDSYPLLPYKRQGEYTAKDREMLPEDVRTELIDGVIYDLAAPSNPHQIVVGELYKLLSRCIEESGNDCYVFLFPSDVWLTGDDKNIVQPDLYIICDYSMLGENGHTKGAPAFVAEILSPSTRSRDILLKTFKYGSAGVKEYWMVDPEKKKVFVCDFVKNPDGTDREEYSFSEKVPVGLSGGTCSIDFRIIEAVLKKLGYV